MKTFIYLIFTCIISTFALWGTLGSKSVSWPCYGIAFGIWAIFLWRWNVRMKRTELRRRLDEYQFREYMRYRHQR